MLFEAQAVSLPETSSLTHPTGHATFSCTASGRRAGRKERRTNAVVDETGVNAITQQLVFIAKRVYGSSS